MKEKDEMVMGAIIAWRLVFGVRFGAVDFEAGLRNRMIL
jgi:hypothetical protein